MSEITTIGLDLAKNVFHLVGCNEHGKEVKHKMLKRGPAVLNANDNCCREGAGHFLGLAV